MNRPIGITLVSCAFAAYSVVVLCSIAWATAHPDNVHAWASTPKGVRDLAWDIYILSPLRIALCFILAYGLWNLRDWARRGAITILLIALLQHAFHTGVIRSFSNGNMPRESMPALEIALSIVQIVSMIYLAIPSVEKAFARAAVTDDTNLGGRNN